MEMHHSIDLQLALAGNELMMHFFFVQIISEASFASGFLAEPGFHRIFFAAFFVAGGNVNHSGM